MSVDSFLQQFDDAYAALPKQTLYCVRGIIKTIFYRYFKSSITKSVDSFLQQFDDAYATLPIKTLSCVRDAVKTIFTGYLKSSMPTKIDVDAPAPVRSSRVVTIER